MVDAHTTAAPTKPKVHVRAALPQFYIPAAASLQERRPRTLKYGDVFAVFDHNGDATAAPGSPEGIYYRDTRHLSHFSLAIDNARPILLSSTLRDDNATLTCDLTNPDLVGGDNDLVLGHDLIHIRRSRFLWETACFERVALMNFDDEPHTVKLTLGFAADFADLFEVRGARRKRHGVKHAADLAPDRVTLGYTGLDDVLRQTILRFDPTPDTLTEDHADFTIELEPRRIQLLFIEIRCGHGPRRPRSQRTARKFFVALRDARRALRLSSSRAASIATSNDIFNEAVRRSVADLYMLVTHTPQGPYPYAGIPWFSTYFGRDALITALQTLWLDPTIALGVLRYLAVWQAKSFDAAADAEPGKILHEVRQGEMAILGEVPFHHYYGSIDSTPLFVMLAGAYLERTGDLDQIRPLWPNIEAALQWIECEGDRDGDGFVEYGRRNAEGLVNQGWKDSSDSIFHADGTLAQGPIALVEVQAYVYGAWRAAAFLARSLGEEGCARALEKKSEELRERFDRSFFDEDLGTYVLALDGDKRPCRVRASNAGHALFTGIAYPERAEGVVSALMNDASFCGWGVRTLASTEARFNPMSYHNGSVWPHDNGLIAAGFARYGFRREALRIFEGLFAASSYVDLRRLPELFCGFPRQRGRGPTFYPVACEPQAWAATARLSLLQSCLGLGFDPNLRQVSFDQPAMPAFLDEITMRGLSLAGGTIDVRLRRAGTGVVVNALERRGDLRLVTTS
jgi:glycogen debranching enzyme